VLWGGSVHNPNTHYCGGEVGTCITNFVVDGKEGAASGSANLVGTREAQGLNECKHSST
jgi:hypothetical protein